MGVLGGGIRHSLIYLFMGQQPLYATLGLAVYVQESQGVFFDVSWRYWWLNSNHLSTMKVLSFKSENIHE